MSSHHVHHSPTWRGPDDGGPPVAHVLLLHGILAKPRQMDRFAGMLRRKGFATTQVGYRSHTGDIDGMVDDVARKLPARPPEATLHVVAFSLGGIVAKAWLARERPRGLGRLVTLGSPHGGQEMADLEERLGFGRLGAPVTTRARSAHDEAHPPHYEFATVAAAIVPGLIQHDGMISVRSTASRFQKEHAVVPGVHRWLVMSPAVAEMAASFLSTGTFGTDQAIGA